MRKIISVGLAGKILMGALILLVFLHVLILLKVVPSDIIWGAQINNSSTNLIMLETIALAVTLVFIGIVAVKMDCIKLGKFKRATNVGVWVIFGYLILNTVGNLASGVSAENLVFAPITLVLAFCALRLAIEK